MAEIAASEILISDLPTKEVIFTPLRATVVREINTTIQPGQNEITLLGIDPNVDVDSIRIEGSGAAIITDIQTEIVPRREQFEDVYPSESDQDENSDDDDEADLSEDEDGIDDPELQAIREQVADIEAKLAKARNDVNSSTSVLSMINDFGMSIRNEKVKNVSKLEEFLAVYNEVRSVEADRHHAGKADVAVGEKYLARLMRKLERRKTKYHKEKREAQKEVVRRKEKRVRARKHKRAQQSRALFEKKKFWTQSVGKVVVSLDSQSTALTPASSRRGSIIEKHRIERSEDAKEKEGTDERDSEEGIEVMLRVSYIVPGPTWAPRYDLSISTPSSSARMTYRAEFKNICSETWRDTRVTLSTSQASFRGIDVRIPTLEAWNIRLDTAQKDSSKGQPNWNGILRSSAEYGAYQGKSLFHKPSPFAPAGNVQSGGLFGKPNNNAMVFGQPARPQGGGFGQVTFGQPAAAPAPSVPKQGGLFGGQVNRGGAFGAQANNNNPFGGGQANNDPPTRSPFGGAAPPQTQQSSSASGLFGAIHHQPDPAEEDSEDLPPTETTGLPEIPPPPVQVVPAPAPSDFSPGIHVAVELEEDDADTQTLVAGPLGHQDSIKQEHGMTTTYEIPGHRTLAPSSVSRRHVLAEFDLKSVTLTYVIVPKHREAAFLRARIKNTSSVTLHPGRVGIRVDNTFVGTASVSTCAPSVHFTVSLGIDPGIDVRYAKPTVTPLSGGVFFNKEDGAKFRRSCWVKNTKTTAVDLIVSDQIPVTEEEKLRLTILEPRGLEKEGDEAPLQMEKRKGKGTAKLHKHGEVKWTLRLEPGQDIRLVLEYETKVPTGHEVCLA